MRKATKALKLADFDVSPTRGFLPEPDPIERLPKSYLCGFWEDLERIANSLPKLLAAGKVRQALNKIEYVYTRAPSGYNAGIDELKIPEAYRFKLLFDFFGHSYVWGGPSETPVDVISEGLALPWYQVSKILGLPPVLSYASYALHNWKRLDPEKPIALGNIVLLQNFLGGLDEEWFILVHVDIEAKAAPALAAIGIAQEAVIRNYPTALELKLQTIRHSLNEMYSTLCRMPENCDPYIYYNRVRPYIHGWKDNPALPNGVIYEGVKEYGGMPQKFRGETGAQSSIIPSLDAALGIEHENDRLKQYLQEMRIYMPPKHKAFIEAIEKGPSIKKYVYANKKQHPSLFDVYEECRKQLFMFRDKHLEYAALYINKQAQRSTANPTDVGTGGTPFMPYLKKHRDETLK